MSTRSARTDDADTHTTPGEGEDMTAIHVPPGEGQHYPVPGGVVVFPAGTTSSFEVSGESARFLAITSGEGAGRFFADFARAVPSDRPVQESMDAILSVTQRHGVRLAGA